VRRRPALLLLAVAAVVVVAVALTRGGGSPTPALLPNAAQVLAADPLAWTPQRDSEYATRAAAGLAHVLYAKSPGGLVASAARTASWRPLIERATRGSAVAPDTLEAIVLLESAGRPEAQAGSLDGAVGLTQVLAETGSGLLGMHVDVAASRRLTRQIARAQDAGRVRRAQRLRARRRVVDERFDPAKILAATVRYLTIARGRVGRDDLAIASYHMGIGNLQTVLARYGASRVPYVQLFFDTTPLRHATAWRFLAALGDDSSTYLWRIEAAREAMRLWREDRGDLAALAQLQTGADSAELALHPPGSTPSYGDADALKGAYDGGALAGLPRAWLASHGVRIDASVADLASQADGDASLFRGLRREALATLAYMGAQVRRIAPGPQALHLAAAVRDTAYQRAEVGAARTAGDALDLTGWSFELARRYASHAQAEALQFVLDRLTALDLIAWSRDGDRIHVTVAADAARLEGPLGVRAR
jgi:hypothetical protein